jgi:hypothetical protein
MTYYMHSTTTSQHRKFQIDKMRLQFTHIFSLCCVILVSLCEGLSPTKKSSKWAEKDSPLPKTLDPHPRNLNRRVFASSCVLLFPNIARAVSPPSPRSLDVGEGVDVLTDARMSQKDAVFPISMEGLWICDRIVTQVEGDSFQAETAWRGLGGTGPLKANRSESFQTRFVRSSSFGDSGVVIDRAFEIASRANGKDISWTVEFPDTLKYDHTNLKVVQRSVELPSDKGFGFNELVRIDDGPIVRAAQIKRRYRRAFDEAGGRVVEGLEIMKTFRVLDGVAGTEFPTSVTKSQIRLRRSN